MYNDNKRLFYSILKLTLLLASKAIPRSVSARLYAADFTQQLHCGNTYFSLATCGYQGVIDQALGPCERGPARLSLECAVNQNYTERRFQLDYPESVLKHLL